MQSNNNSTRKHSNLAIAIFIGFWLVVAIFAAISPFESVFGHTSETFFLIFLFVLIIAGTAFVWQFTPIFRISEKQKTLKTMSADKMRFILKFSTIGTFIGNAFILLDRIVFRGIDYSEGLRAARYQWLQSDISGSPISIIGNLLIPFSYCALLIGLYHWESLRRSEKIIALVAGFGGQICFALINGGRSNLLIAIAFSVAVCVIRKYRGKSFFPRIRGKAILAAIILYVLFRYLELIFFAFAENTDSYLQVMALGLGVRVDSTYHGTAFLNLFLETCLYLIHGNYNIGAILADGPQIIGFADLNHNMTFRSLLSLLGRLPFFEYKMELPSFDSGMGAFISLPGVLLYDYGFVGFFLVSLFLGILFGEVLKILNSSAYSVGIGKTVFALAVLINIYLSMVTTAMNLGYFWFMVFALVAMEMISRKKYGSSNWTETIKEDQNLSRG